MNYQTYVALPVVVEYTYYPGSPGRRFEEPAEGPSVEVHSITLKGLEVHDCLQQNDFEELIESLLEEHAC